MSELTLRRRFDRQVVRFQARIEAGAGDRWIPTLTAVTLAAVLARSGLARLASLDTGLELAGYSQALWLLSEGKVPQASLLGTDVHLLELHWAFIMYPLAPLVWLFSAPEVLIVAQAVALAATVFPLWWLARRVAKLRIAAASALIAAYALHPATHRLGVEDFHPEALAVPALVGVAYFGATKRWTWYWISIAFVLACRADLGLAVALWGFVVLGHRERTVGIWTLGVGLIWSLGLLFVAQPLTGESGVVPGTFGYGGESLANIMLGGIRDPLGLVQDLLARDNISLVVGLLAPLIFLPLLSLRHLAPAMPLATLYLITDLPADAAYAERSSMFLAFMMIAATHALKRLGNMGVDRVFLDGRVLSTLVAASVLLYVSSSPISPYERPWQWGELDSSDVAALEAIEGLDPEVAVRASPSTLAQLAERPWVFPLATDSEPSAAQAGFPDFTRAVLVLESEIPERTDEERMEFDRSMQAQGFQVVLRDLESQVVLYSRADTAGAGG
ncbi:MAG: DUF2079 domain-containing protein [Actinomycetota bacterium]